MITRLDKKLRSRNYDTVLDLGSIKIKVDLRSWVLFIAPSTTWYYTSLDVLFNDLLELTIKNTALKNPKKDLQSFAKSIEESKKYINSIIKQLTTVKLPPRTPVRPPTSNERSQDEE